MLLCQGGFLEMTSSISSKGNNMMRLKQENQSSIRKIIYLRGPVLRSSIAEDLHLTLPTITTNVNAMLQSGILFEDRDNVVMTPGRSALPVDIVPDSRYFIGVEITQMSAFVTTVGQSSLPVLIIPYIRNIAKYCNPQPVWCRLHSSPPWFPRIGSAA